MSDDQDQTSPSDRKLSPLATIAGGYAISVGALYLLGFWGRFHIDALEFIGVGDILRYSIFPFLVSAASLIAALSVQGFYATNLDVAAPESARKHWRWLTLGDIALICLVYIFVREPDRWIVIAFLSAFLAPLVRDVDYLVKLMPNLQFRSRVVFLAIGLAGYAFAWGRENAYRILNGEGQLEVDARASDLSLEFDGTHHIEYVGRLGEVYVLYESATSHVIILRAEKVDALVLTKNPKLIAR